MRKFLCSILAMLCFTLCACGRVDKSAIKAYTESDFSDIADTSIKELYEMSLDQEFIKLYVNSDKVNSIIKGFSETAVEKNGEKYIIKNSDIYKLLENEAKFKLNQFSEIAQNNIKASVSNMLVSIINAKSGVDYVASASVLKASKSYVAKSFEPQVWFLPTNDSETVVYVIFADAGENVLSVSSGFIHCEGGIEEIKALTK